MSWTHFLSGEAGQRHRSGVFSVESPTPSGGSVGLFCDLLLARSFSSFHLGSLKLSGIVEHPRFTFSILVEAADFMFQLCEE